MSDTEYAAASAASNKRHKREFIEAYVIAMARGGKHSDYAPTPVYYAKEVWEAIEREMSK